MKGLAQTWHAAMVQGEGTTPANVGKLMICCRKRNHNVFVNAGCRVVKIGAWGIVVVKRHHVDAPWPMANMGSYVFVNTMVSVNVRRCAVANGQPGVVRFVNTIVSVNIAFKHEGAVYG